MTMKQRRYRYQRTDFEPLPVQLNHMSIYLDFREDKVVGTNTLYLTARQPLQEIALDAKELEVLSVRRLCDAGPEPIAPVQPGDSPGGDVVPFVYDRERSRLTVQLPQVEEPGTLIVLFTETACVPSDTILEGIYKDTTPLGAPQQYVSQCEQWGFQRFLPVLDDCTAKCTMTTTLEGDARYTHLISNGDISPSRNPHGRPVPKPGDGSRQVITYDNAIPMAPYLFIACAGTWDVLADEVIYPSGRRVGLEYLVPPGRLHGAELPMKILKASVQWQGKAQDYEYRYDVYRTICMEKSNFGGMENVGNTTIITSAALVDEFTDDPRLKYAYAIIVHEFEHNQCGSDVTMETPFDMWLNEAFTVDVERQFMADLFDPVCMRLNEVDAMRSPLSGPLTIEDGGHTGNIVREGFNDPDELVDGVTYVKAAEVVRMLRLILGEETFRKSKELYFTRYDGGNANTEQFLACFEEVSGRDLSQFRKEWLHTIGYPNVEVAHTYNAEARRLSIILRQGRVGRGGCFQVPVALAAVDETGRDIPSTVTVAELVEPETELHFDGVDGPAFLSVNRDCSFYGSLVHSSATREELVRQVRLDSNGFNRVEAMRRITDAERIRLIHEPGAAVSDEWLDLWGEILTDETLPPGLKGYMLRVDELSLDREFLPYYRERYAARERLLRILATRFMPELLAAFESVDTYRRGHEPKDGMEERGLKANLLRTIIAADTPQSYEVAEQHLGRAWNISDRLAALGCLYISSHPGRLEMLEDAYREWKDHLTAYTNYLRMPGSGIREEAFDMIAKEEARQSFKIDHPGHIRSLFLPMAANNKLLWTDRGIAWMTETVIRMAPINETTTNRLLAAFQLVHKLADDLRPKVLEALRRMRNGIESDKAPSVTGNIVAYLGPEQ